MRINIRNWVVAARKVRYPIHKLRRLTNVPTTPNAIAIVASEETIVRSVVGLSRKWNPQSPNVKIFWNNSQGWVEKAYPW